MPREVRFSRIIRQAFRDCSTKTTCAAPRLSASIPMPPMPAQPSRKVVCSMLAPRMLNSVSLSLSLVGRIPGGGVALRRRLLNRPEIILICVQRNSHKRHKMHKDLFVHFVPFVADFLPYSHKLRPRRQRLNEPLAFLGTVRPALRFFLRE